MNMVVKVDEVLDTLCIHCTDIPIFPIQETALESLSLI